MRSFKLNTLTPDHFKCLVFVIGLTSQQDTDIRTRMLVKIDTSEKITLAELADECQNVISIKTDTNMVGSSQLKQDLQMSVNKITESKTSTNKKTCKKFTKSKTVAKHHVHHAGIVAACTFQRIARTVNISAKTVGTLDIKTVIAIALEKIA